MTAALTERRKADRVIMAERIQAISASFGAVCERCQLGTELIISIRTARGLRVGVGLDGRSVQPDVFVMAWNIASDSDAKLSPNFGDVNSCHYHKATHVAHGFDAVAAELARGLSMDADGSAFQTEIN